MPELYLEIRTFILCTIMKTVPQTLQTKTQRARKDSLPKVMTPCALTLVGREFVLNWDKGSEAGSSSWGSVNNEGHVSCLSKPDFLETDSIICHHSFVISHS